MRSLVTLLAIIFCALVLTSCTDEAKELEERIENERQIKQELNKPKHIDKDEIENPRDRQK